MTIPDKHPALLVHQVEPFNAGPPLELLGKYPITPAAQFFVRNHGNIPLIDPATFVLTVIGLVDAPLQFSLAALRATSPWVEATATLQCAGMRRQELQAVAPTPGELPWGAEAISTGVWGGVRLRDVLAHCEIDPAARHVGFTGLDTVERLGQRFGFGGSIPLEHALTADVLLALELNGAPLPPTHGAPLRAVVPGYLGARSVKWLATIELLAEPSTNYFQRRAYRIWRSGDPQTQLGLDEAPLLGPLPVNAVICDPADGATVAAGVCAVHGFAIGTGGSPVTLVELSDDDGRTWVAATLTPAPAGTWTQWRAELRLPAGEQTLIVRATDAAGQTQPADMASVWNVKGYYNNAWQRVRVSVVASSSEDE